MQYDISSIDKSADILSAVLRVYKHSNHVSYTLAAAYTVHEITEAWDQNTVGWSDGWSTEGGSFAPQALDTFSYDGTYNGWFEFDVTETVRKRLADKTSSYGFILQVPGDPETGISKNNQESYFYSTESSDFEYLPHIQVTLDGTSLQETESTHLSMQQKVDIRHGVLTISLQENTTLFVYTIKGQLLKRQNFRSGKHSLPLQGLAPGCVLVQLVNTQGSLSRIVPVR